MLKFNLQKFADGADGKPEAPPDPKSEKQGKVFSEDYVTQIREEAKNHRIAKKQYEAMLRNLLGLKDEEEINPARIEAYKQTQAQAVAATMEKANARLVAAEIKNLTGYDAKLLDRLLDKGKVKVGEDGVVSGLKEAVEALATEFPQIKVGKTSPPPAAPGGANPPPTNVGEKDRMIEQYNAAEKNRNFPLMIELAEQIRNLKK